jgi:3-oxoacyl-[acyl-carrier-protein] synthase II
METRRIVITGTGVISPLGNHIKDFWKAICDGTCGIRKLTGLDEWNLSVSVAGQVQDFDPLSYGISLKDSRRNDIYCNFAVAAAAQAMAESGLDTASNIAPERLGVYIGSGIGGLDTFVNECKVLFEEGAGRISPLFIPTMIANMAGGNIAIQYNAQGPCLTHVAACASSTYTIGEAFQAIKLGKADAFIAGGTEAVVNPIAIGGFANSKALTLATDPKQACLPFDRRRTGFVMGEGAAVMVLEEYEHARRRGASIIAEVVGYGSTCDAYHITAPRPDGTAAARAIAGALHEAEYDASRDKLYINAHGTGTVLNDKCETLAIKLALGEAEAHKVAISSSKSMTGHLFGAAGALEILISALALHDGIVPPTIGLQEADPECDLDYTPLNARRSAITVAVSNSLGFGGHNACVALRKI